MQRINVIGTSGSGKSSFGRALAQRLDCPYIEMDQLHWKPQWEESSSEELFHKLEKALAKDRWVLDGNYSKTDAIKWRRADTLIWLDYSFFRTFSQLLRRTLQRARSEDELWPGTGNRESLRMAFLSHDSILLWCLRTYWKNKRRYGALEAASADKGMRFVRLRSPQEAMRFLDNCRV